MDLFIARLDAVLKRRKQYRETHKEGVALDSAKCEICFTTIRNYYGPEWGIACAECLALGKNQCTRIEPLAITRSAIRE